MNKFDFALSLVRAPIMTRLQDRTLWGMILSVAIAIWLHVRGSIDGNTCLLATTTVIAAWSGLEQINKSVVANAVLKNNAPDTMNIAGDLNTTTKPPEVPSAPVEAALPPTRHDSEPTEDF